MYHNYWFQPPKERVAMSQPTQETPLEKFNKVPLNREPAVQAGTFTGLSVAGLMATFLAIWPNALDAKTAGIIVILGTFILPFGTALLIRGFVWSPASVALLIKEAEENVAAEFVKGKDAYK